MEYQPYQQAYSLAQRFGGHPIALLPPIWHSAFTCITPVTVSAITTIKQNTPYTHATLNTALQQAEAEDEE